MYGTDEEEHFAASQTCTLASVVGSWKVLSVDVSMHEVSSLGSFRRQGTEQLRSEENGKAWQTGALLSELSHTRGTVVGEY